LHRTSVLQNLVTHLTW